MRVLYLIPGFACLFIGCVFLLVFRYILQKQEPLDRSIRGQTWGKLAGMESRTERNYENRAHTVYFGIYEYDTADGQHISSTSDFGCYAPEEVPGSQGNMVKIHYNPENPAEFALSEEQAMAKAIWPKFKKTGVTLTVLGILLTLVAFAAILGFFDLLVGNLFGQV